jgi:hypothetical protein
MYHDIHTTGVSEEISRDMVDFALTSSRLNTGIINDTKTVFEVYRYDADPSTSRPYMETLRQVQKMTSLLRHPKATTFHVLACLGFYHDKPKHILGVAFRAPPYFDKSKKPVTLLQLYKREERVPLGHRIRLTSALAVALDHFHIVGWVHKGIRSENIAFLPMKTPQHPELGDSGDITETFIARQGSVDLASPYLFGFEYMRMGDAGTNLDTDYSLDRNLYRHPDRWGIPLLRFEKGHDVYALVSALV